MRWFERSDVLGYIVNCYQGTEGRKRQFVWEEPNGDIVIGNTRAFGDHLNTRFNLELTPTSWMAIHEALRAMGEVLHEYSPRTHVRGQRFKNQVPEVRILKRADRRK